MMQSVATGHGREAAEGCWSLTPNLPLVQIEDAVIFTQERRTQQEVALAVPLPCEDDHAAHTSVSKQHPFAFVCWTYATHPNFGSSTGRVYS